MNSWEDRERHLESCRGDTLCQAAGELVFRQQPKPSRVSGEGKSGRLPMHRFHFDDELRMIPARGDVMRGGRNLIRSTREAGRPGDFVLRKKR